jgi:hypothetical protein
MQGFLETWKLFQGFLQGKNVEKGWPIGTLLYILFKHILITLTSFMGTPNSVRILYNTLILTES